MSEELHYDKSLCQTCLSHECAKCWNNPHGCSPLDNAIPQIGDVPKVIMLSEYNPIHCCFRGGNSSLCGVTINPCTACGGDALGFFVSDDTARIYCRRCRRIVEVKRYADYSMLMLVKLWNEKEEYK